MTEVITLDSKDVKKILAKFFGIDEKQVIPSRYSWSIGGMSASDVEKKING